MTVLDRNQLTASAVFSDPLRRGLSSSSSVAFSLLGTSLRLESNSALVIAAARESFGSFGDQEEGAGDFLLEVLVDPELQEAADRTTVYRAHGDYVHIACGSSFGVADLRRRLSWALVTSGLAADSSYLRNSLLDCLFYVQIMRWTHTPVHCAAVGSGDRSVLICGCSGAGKSTLAYACLKLGLQLFTDDVAYLCLASDGDRLLMWGNPWHLRLLPDCPSLFPELASTRPRPRAGHEPCVEISVARCFPRAPRSSSQPLALVFLNPGCRKEDAALEPLSQSWAFERLQSDIILDYEPVVQRHQAVLRRLTTVPCYRLSAAADPLVTASVLGRLLDS
ncbi:MAG: hypothetical protein AB1898_05925 [Acidobacteriota bacterium]